MSDLRDNIKHLTEQRDTFRDKCKQLEAENQQLMEEREKLVEVLEQLRNAAMAIVGADMGDEDAEEAFEMYFDASAKAKAALASLEKSNG